MSMLNIINLQCAIVTVRINTALILVYKTLHRNQQTEKHEQENDNDLQTLHRNQQTEKHEQKNDNDLQNTKHKSTD